MKTVLAIFIPLVLFAWISGIKISFKPFRVTFTDGWFAIGVLILCVGLTIMRYQTERKIYRKAFTAGVDATIENIDKFIDDKMKQYNEKD